MKTDQQSLGRSHRRIRRCPRRGRFGDNRAVPDPLADSFDFEIVPCLKAARSIQSSRRDTCEALRKRGNRIRRTIERRVQWRAVRGDERESSSGKRTSLAVSACRISPVERAELQDCPSGGHRLRGGLRSPHVIRRHFIADWSPPQGEAHRRSARCRDRRHTVPDPAPPADPSTGQARPGYQFQAKGHGRVPQPTLDS